MLSGVEVMLWRTWLLVTVWVMVLVGRTGSVDQVSTRSVLPYEAVTYTEPKLNQSYRSSTEFDPKGMEHLYYITNMFLDVIQRDDTAALDRRQLEAARKAGNLTETFVELGLYNWPTLLSHHLGFAILAGIGITVALVTPIIGLLICCSRCAGKCGGRTDPYEKRHDKYKRICNGVFLSFIVIIILFGLVASFVVNQYIENGVTEVPPRLHLAVDDSQLFVQNTKKEVRYLLVDNFKELKTVLDVSLDKCGDRVKAKLANISRAVAVEDLTVIAEGLSDIRQDLNAIADRTQLLQRKADQLSVGLRDVQSELSVLLAFCRSPGCQLVLQQYNMSQLAVENEFRQLPDVTRTAREISSLIENGIESEVRAGKRSFDQLSERIQSEVRAIVPEVRQRLTEAGSDLEATSANITSVLDSIQLRPAHRAIDTADLYLKQYGSFRYYVFVIISGLVVVMVFCLVMGLFCGLCGHRPGQVYGDDTCNKGAGANFLLSGVFFYFLFGWLLLLAVTCLFLVGGLAQFYLCDGLADPSAPGSGLALLQAVYPVQQLYPELKQTNFDLADVIRKCHQNGSIYTVLNLEPLYDISEVKRYKQRLGIDEELDKLRNQIQVDTDVEILTPRGKEQLYEFAQSDVARINFTAFTRTLEDRITSVDLGGMGDALESAAEQLPSSQRDAANRLRNQAIILKAQQRVVGQMADIVVSLRNSTLSLQEHVKFNRTNVTEAVRELIGQAEGAQQYLRTRGSTEVLQLADQYAAEFLSHLDDYAARVERSFRSSLGRCGPLSTAYNSTAVTLCSNVIYPFNGFWASVGWCLVLLIPSIIISLVLASLYRKTEGYREGLMETEYLYDAYGEHDSMPLANVREPRSGGGKRGVGGGRRGNGVDNNTRYHGYSPDSPPYTAIPPRGQHFRPSGGGDQPDTEPKAPPLWDLNGGPPGYTESPGAAGDFERPPPYFYPGPGPNRS